MTLSGHRDRGGLLVGVLELQGRAIRNGIIVGQADAELLTDFRAVERELIVIFDFQKCSLDISRPIGLLHLSTQKRLYLY